MRKRGLVWCATAFSAFLGLVTFGGCSPRVATVERGVHVKDGFVFDYGVIKEGEVVNHTFTIENTTGAIVTIREVRSTCGCVATDSAQKVVAPDQNATVPISFDSRNLSGNQDRRILVLYNVGSGEVRTLDLVLRGRVLSKLDIFPRMVHFGEVNVGQEVNAQVIISSDVYRDFVIESVEPVDDSLKCIPRKVGEGRYELALSFVRHSENAGNSVRIKLANHEMSYYHLTYTWKDIFPIEVVPSSIIAKTSEDTFVAELRLKPVRLSRSISEIKCKFQTSVDGECELSDRRDTVSVRIRRPRLERLTSTKLEIVFEGDVAYVPMIIPVVVTWQ